MVETTVTTRERIAPLVVSVLFAHLRLALSDSSTRTTQSSALDSSRQRSTISCGVIGVAMTSVPAFVCRVENPHRPEQRRRAAVRDRSDLARLRLAAVEGATEDIRLRPTDGGHRPQKSVVVAWYATSLS